MVGAGHLKGWVLVTSTKMVGSTMQPWMESPSRTVKKYQPSFLNSAVTSWKNKIKPDHM